MTLVLHRIKLINLWIRIQTAISRSSSRDRGANLVVGSGQVASMFAQHRPTNDFITKIPPPPKNNNTSNPNQF